MSYKIGLKIRKMGGRTAEPPYHTQVWEQSPNGSVHACWLVLLACHGMLGNSTFLGGGGGEVKDYTSKCPWVQY